MSAPHPRTRISWYLPGRLGFETKLPVTVKKAWEIDAFEAVGHIGVQDPLLGTAARTIARNMAIAYGFHSDLDECDDPPRRDMRKQ